MGFLSKREPVDDGNLLGFNGTVGVPKAMARERDQEIARRIMFGQVIATEVRVVGMVATLAQQAAAQVSRTGELAAAVVPEERERVDTITETATIVMNQSIQKLAQQ